MKDQETVPAETGAVRDALTKDERHELVALTLAAEIRREMDAAETAWRDAVGHAIRAGELLIEAKEQLKHGEWGPWLKTHFAGSERHAQNLMRMARNPQRVAGLSSIREALEVLTKPSKPAEYVRHRMTMSGVPGSRRATRASRGRTSRSIRTRGISRPATTRG